LEKCLRSIREQTYRNVEVIVVDNHSKDRTREIAEKYADSVLLKGSERCAQVNFGVSQAKGKYVYRVDSDFVLELNVIEEAVWACEKKGYDGIIVHNTSDPTVSFLARVRKMERDCYRDDKINVAARFWKKGVFELVGGFDVNLVAGDDYDLHNRLVKSGFRIGRIEAEEVHVGEPKTLTEVFRKHYYYGKNIICFIRKNQRKALVQLSPIRLSLAKGFSKFSDEPALIVGFFVYELLRYAAVGLGMLTTIFKRNTSPTIAITEFSQEASWQPS
jgi:glycosyltransferase involved in cell wall biosynthesis